MTSSRYPRRPRRPVSLRPCPSFPQVRHLTVSTVLCNGVATPWIRIKGQWLKQAGFPPQSEVRLVVNRGRLVIEPIER